LNAEQNSPTLSWKDSIAWGVILIGIYCLAALSPLLVAWFIAEPLDDPRLVKLALALGMVGFSLLCLQVVLTGRFHTLDRPFGLDVVTQFHQKMALVALSLLVLHPVLIAVEHRSLALFGLQMPWQVNLGKGALLLLVLGVLFALFFARMRVDVNVWRWLHKGMILVVVLGFVHGLVIGPHFQQSVSAKGYWWAMLAGVAGVFSFRNFVVPFLRREYQVTDVQQESRDVHTLTLAAEKASPLCIRPGQFMFLKLIRPGRSSEMHPFTIADASSKGRRLQATIKQSGNFTDTIAQTQPADRARVECPFGRFSYIFHDPPEILFIAGGIGITPIMHMIRHLREHEDHRPVTLLYANKTPDDILFGDELVRLPENFKTVHVLSQADDTWSGERGYITAEIIHKHAGQTLPKAHVYLCGPPVMMEKVLEVLHALEIRNSKIHYERFSL
jgi:predicted ferric reductase